MLKVDRQSGGFTPLAPLNRVPSGCSTGVESLEHSPDIPIVPLWQNSYNLSFAIPLGRFAPLLFCYELCLPCEIHDSDSEAYFTGELSAIFTP